MTRLLLELEIDAACDEFLRSRGVGGPQPVVAILDAMPPEDDERGDEWDDLTVRAAKMFAHPQAETTLEMTNRLLDKMDV